MQKTDPFPCDKQYTSRLIFASYKIRVTSNKNRIVYLSKHEMGYGWKHEQRTYICTRIFFCPLVKADDLLSNEFSVCEFFSRCLSTAV